MTNSNAPNAVRFEQDKQMSDTHTPLPWHADPDDREGYEWNIHILDASGINRICFMSNGPSTEANAALIVEAVNSYAKLREQLVSARRATSQLRHAYSQLKAGTVKDQEQFADGLIAPQIRILETALSDDDRRCVDEQLRDAAETFLDDMAKTDKRDTCAHGVKIGNTCVGCMGAAHLTDDKDQS